MKPKRKADKHYTFLVGSLIDPNPSDYIAVCNSEGEIVKHIYNGKEFQAEQEVTEIIKEVKNPMQISLF